MTHSKGHHGQTTAKTIHQRAEAVTRIPADIESKALIVSIIAKQLLLINQNLSQIRKTLEEIKNNSKRISLLTSVPGICVILASRLIGEIVNFDRFEKELKLAMYIGIAPVSDDSGKRKNRHRTTHRVNKVAKDAILQMAVCNARVCSESKAYITQKGAEGNLIGKP